MVIACGGDGTINEIVNGLAGSQVPMALLPAGTANILAKELGIPWDIRRAAHLIPGGTVRRIALGAAFPRTEIIVILPPKGAFFCPWRARDLMAPSSTACTQTLRRMRESPHIGLKGCASFSSTAFRKYEFARRAASAKPRSSLWAGPRIMEARSKSQPARTLFEDSFEFVTNSRRNRLGYAACLPALFLGSLRNMDGIEAWKSGETICEPAGSEPIYAQVDGEPVGPLPVAFRIVPDALSIVTPAR